MRIGIVAAVLCLSFVELATAQHASAEIRKPTHIVAQGLGPALKELARSRGLQVLYISSAVHNVHTSGASGDMTANEAFDQLLSGTGLTYRYVDENTVTIIAPDATSPNGDSPRLSSSSSKEGKDESSDTFRVAQRDQGKAASTVSLDQPARQAPARDSEQLEEIMVTARKRQESILNVPVIEVAISREKLESLQTVEITDLPDLVPGLQFGRSVLAIGTQVSIRGVGSTSLDPGVDPSVALNIDGVSPGTGLAYESGMFDLAQVEVLKGPQALFFGKSTPGGVIALRTADPTDEFEVIARESYDFVAATPREEAIISGPITDTLKARLAAMYSTTEGYFKNTGIGDPSLGGATPTDPRSSQGYDYIVRETTLWNPIDQLDARLKLNLVRDHIVDQEVSELSDCPEGRNFEPFGIPFIGNDPCQINGNDRMVWMNPADYPGIINNGVPFTDIQQEFTTLELNYRPIQDLTVTSVTADYLVDSTSLINATATTDAGPALAAENFFHRRESTEEFRVNSDFSSPVNFTAGAFYEDGMVTEAVDLPGNTALGLPGNLGSDVVPVAIRTYSAFGQGRWKIVPRLELAAGMRWSDETRTESPVTSAGVPIPVMQPRVHADNNSPEVTLTYKPTDDVTTFAAYKQGFKSGSFVLSTPVAPGANNAFGEETVRGGEVGVKSLLLDHRLTANLAAYLYNYSGLQVGAVQPAQNGVISIQTLNAGAARTYGLDFDTAYRPAVEGLGVNAALDWNRARYLNLDNVPCWGGQTVAQGCNQFLSSATGLYTAQNLSSTPMIRAPEWQLRLGFNYEYPLGSDYKLAFTNNNAFSSRYVTFLAVHRPNDDNYQGSFVKSDLSVSFQASNGGWELALIGKDLNDKITTGACSPANYAAGAVLGGQITGGTSSGPAGVDQVSCSVDPGRAIWLRLTVRPFASRN